MFSLPCFIKIKSLWSIINDLLQRDKGTGLLSRENQRKTRAVTGDSGANRVKKWLLVPGNLRNTRQFG